MKYKMYILSPLLAISLFAQEVIPGNTVINFGGAGTMGTLESDDLYRYEHYVGFGEALVGTVKSGDGYSHSLGQFSFYLKRPEAPLVNPSAGDYPDKIVVEWCDDILSPPSMSGYKLYRDNSYIVPADFGVEQYNDHNVYPAEMYNYAVKGKNSFGWSPLGENTGFVNPNGRITGHVKTQTHNNPVPGVEVMLYPYLGKSLSFDGDNDYVQAPNLNETSAGTIEMWLLPQATGNGNYFLANGDAVALTLSMYIVNDNALVVSIYDGNWDHIRTSLGSISTTDWNHLAITWNNSTAAVYINGAKQGEIATAAPGSVGGNWYLGASTASGALSSFTGYIDEVRVWNTALDSAAIAKNMHRVVDAHEDALVAEWRLDEGTGSKVFDNSDNSYDAHITGTVWSNDIPVIHNSAFTDVQGNYEISSINYGTGSTFTVTPQKHLHEFDPPSRIIALDLNGSAANNVDFNDISQIAVSGYISFGLPNSPGSCFADSIDIYHINENGDTVTMIPPVQTDDDGYFVVEFEPGSSPTIVPRYKDHEFWPAFYSYENLLEDMARQDFIDIKKRDLILHFFGGEIKAPLGGAEVVVKSTPECFEQTYQTGGNGFLRISNLPPQHYVVTMRPTNPDHPEFAQYFQDNEGNLEGYSVNLKDQNDSLGFMYRAPLELAVTGFNPSNCTSLFNSEHQPGVILTQNSARNITILVKEDYLGHTCYLRDADFTIIDEISDIDQQQHLSISIPDSIPNQDCDTLMPVYTLNPGQPNIVSPYHKKLEITVTDDMERTQLFTLYSIVEGHRARESTFVTRFPDMPFYILRDPPGDQSYCELIEESRMTTTWSMDSKHTIFTDNTAHIRTGTKFEVGFGWTTETEVWLDVMDYFSFQVDVNETEEWQFTMTTSDAFATSADDIILGDEGDLYIGGGLNMTYGITDVLEVDKYYCSVELSKSIVMAPNGFETFFTYTDSYIRNHLIPNLYDLQTAEDTISAHSWEDILFTNDSLKNVSEFVENRSFNGGSSYTHTQETEHRNTVTYSRSTWIHNEIAIELGFIIGGTGGENKFRNIIDITTGESRINTEVTHNTIRYKLADDDPDDYFSVDIYKDPVYGTPVFKLVSGTSSAPWEPPTQKRDMPQLLVDPNILTNLNGHESGYFTMNLGNLSESEDEREYHLRSLNQYNPHGAILKVNGTALGDGVISYTIPYGESWENILSVERGPLAYEYDSLALILYPLSEYENWQAGGGAIDDGLVDTAWFSVHFIEPCTEAAELTWPHNDWLITQPDSFLNVSISGYNLADSSLEKIEFQYSYLSESLMSKITDENDNTTEESAEHIIIGEPGIPENWPPVALLSSSDWITTVTFTKDTLDIINAVSFNYDWPSYFLDDGNYAIRLKTTCISGIKQYSEEFSGHIDNTPPQVLGTPHPVDDVLNADDEIALYFQEEIDINSVTANGIWVWNITNPGWVDVEFTAYENSIVLRPVTHSHFIENCDLRAEVKEVKDIYGNMMPDSVEWDFFVDRNPVHWNQTYLSGVNIMGEGGNMEITLRNTGAKASLYEFSSDPWYLNQYLTDLPEWLSATPVSGQLNPGGNTEVLFSLSPMLNFGEYEETIFAHTTEGDEPLTLSVRSLCPPPDWVKDYSDLPYSMAVTAQISVRGKISEDSYDCIGAFIDNENNGYAPVEKVMVNDSLSIYLAFLDIHHNTQSAEHINFRIWDASECEEYYDVPVNIPFADNSIVGSPNNPLILNASGAVAQIETFKPGWNWFSIHLDNPDSTLLTVAEAFSHEGQFSENDRIIHHSAHESYSNRSHSWLPGTMTLNPASMYMAHLLDNVKTIIVGYEINPDSIKITVYPGWNWLGYPLRYNHSINEALINLNPGDGATIKSELGFAEYVSDWGQWIGSLEYMTPGHGYLLKLTHSDTIEFTYAGLENPLPPAVPTFAKTKTNEDFPKELAYNEKQYPWRMPVIAELWDSELQPNHTILYAVSDDSIRAVASAQYVDKLESWRYFLNIAGNRNETIELRLYDQRSGKEYQAKPTIVFDANADNGRLLAPLTIEKGDLVIPEEFYLAQNYPNPFNPITYIEFGLPERATVNLVIYDVTGRRVKEILNNELEAGRHTLIWNAVNDYSSKVASGVYFLVLQTPDQRFVKKMIYLK